MPPMSMTGHPNALSSSVTVCFAPSSLPQMNISGGPPDMFICGNDEGAKQTVTELLKAFGWPVIDIGGIEASRLLEPMALLWISYLFKTKSPSHAFKLLRK